MSLLANLLGPRQAFDGGLFLPDHKAGLARKPIETLSVDGPLNVPLTFRASLKTTPLVKTGDRVQRGQIIAKPVHGAGLPAHAPVSGKIVEFSHAWTPYEGSLPSAVIMPEPDSESPMGIFGWEAESLIGQLMHCGVVCTNPRMPLHELIRQAVDAGVSTLIVNAMETEPYLTADLRTLVEESGRIVDITCEIADALGVSRAIIAAPFRHRRVQKRLYSEAIGRLVEVAPLPDLYPQCHPTLLIKSLLGFELPPGDTPLEHGVVVLPLSAVRAAADALFNDKPVTHAVLTVAGDAISRPGTYRVAVGTPLRRLTERAGLIEPAEQIICGGPLTGIQVDNLDAVVTADMNAVLAFSTREKAEPAPCIHCGWCVEDCPVGLVPPDLFMLETRSTCSPIDHSHLRACIDCGLCTHVCPSHLPLAEAIRRSRLRFDGPADSQCDPVT